MEAIVDEHCSYRYKARTADFQAISGTPIAYWAHPQIRQAFSDGQQLREFADPQSGLQTSDNERFIRHWHEVSFKQIGFDSVNNSSAQKSQKRWFPHNKGGKFKRWYGNRELVVNWHDDGREIKDFVNERYPYLKGNTDYVIKDRGYFFKEGITWSHSTSSFFSARYAPAGAISNVEGPTLFSDAPFFYLGLLNSSSVWEFLSILNPTLHFLVGNVRELPMPTDDFADNSTIDEVVKRAVEISRADFNQFESSWEFVSCPILLSLIHI